MEIFFMCCMMDEKDAQISEMPEKDWPFLSKIIMKRIEALKLPIKFSAGGLMAVNTLCDRPGSAVLLLIECLNYFENQTIDTDKLSALYPEGFYSEEALTKIIDEELKTRKMKWSNIY
jgi:hypothetical protein